MWIMPLDADDPECRQHPGVSPTETVSLAEATRTWFAISLQTFGGPAGQIAVMQRTLVTRKKWLDERRFLDALSYCMLLPGPEAQQLAIYTGWLLNGYAGGLIAGVLFVVPGFLAMLALSWAYLAHGDTAWMSGLFAGLAPAVVAVVAFAAVRLSKRALPDRVSMAIAVCSFVAVAVLGVPFPLVIGAAALTGWLAHRAAGVEPGAVGSADPQSTAGRESSPPRPSVAPHPARTLGLLIVVLVIWWLPIGLAAYLFGRDSVLVAQGTFFAGTAVVTFGGAYAVLAYVAQHAVAFGWVSNAEMIRGLALAETTPGPLIMVVQFVAFLGAYRDPGSLNPWLAGLLASALTVWATFVPGFGFIFLGAPYLDRLRSRRGLSQAMTGISAAVLGVIASQAFYFAVHALFARTTTLGGVVLPVPVWSSINASAVALALLAGLLLWRGWSSLRTIALCGLIGAVLGVALGGVAG